MKRLAHTSIVVMLALLVCAAPGMADASDQHSFDANGDGKITFEEVMKHVEHSARQVFDSLDRNSDGVLSSDDFDDMRKGMQQLQDWLDHLLKPFTDEGEPPRKQPKRLSV